MSAPVAPDLVDVGALFRAHAPFLLRTVERLAGSGAHVEEIVQDTFVLAHRNAPKLASHSNPRAWLYVTARNLVQHHKRGFARRARLRDRVSSMSPTETTPSPADVHARSEHGARIRRVVQALPLHKREVIVLFELEGLSGVEVATLIGVPVGTVWTRLADARASFKVAWSELLAAEGP